MYNQDTELLYPYRVTPALRDLRGPVWRKLVDKVAKQPPEAADQMAFVLMMVRIDGCMSCNADSFRAMKGCTLCAQDAIRRYRGDDAELVAIFEQARSEIEKVL